MTFTSLAFVVFFLLLLVLRPWARTAGRETWLLLIASYVFYLTSGLYGVLLVILTSVIDFNVGRRLGTTEDPSGRRRWLFVSLATNLGILGFFKYTNFFLDNLSAISAAVGIPLAAAHSDIALPIGLSYFTFTGISYVLDVYYERMEPCRNAKAYLLYIAYFPKILAGPLVRAREFLPQIEGGLRPSAADVETGVSYFLIGVVKKVVIADQLADHVSMIFATPHQYDAPTLLLGLIGYTVQIYCDFSGYSDMAIGCARIMGVRLPENFMMPYSAVNITEFWRRWHITLSTWFRDYVFLPLEIAMKGMSSATARTSLNLMVTMVLCGFWHGAGWNFVIWGGIHGGALVVHKMWRSWRPLRTEAYPVRLVRTLAARALTLAVIMVGWIFFRSETWAQSTAYFAGLLTWQDGLRLGSPYIPPLATLVFVAHLAFDKDRNWAQELPGWPAPVRVGAYSALMLWISLMAVADSTPFVYVQF
jgi:alginate O-acetyltransferase complex protein AlgI